MCVSVIFVSVSIVLIIIKYSKSVRITDGNEVVLRLIEKNLVHLQLQSEENRGVSAGSLIWGVKSEVY